MTAVCMYFQVHQPYRLRKYSYFDIGQHDRYIDHEKNRYILRKVADKCYLPTNAVLHELIQKHKGAFKVAFSFSGIVLEQFKTYYPEVIDSFKALVDTGCVEVIHETYYHSLSFLYSIKEFKSQIRLQQDLVKELFGQTSSVFRNTELIYNNDIAQAVSELGFEVILGEGAEKILGWRSPNFLYKTCSDPGLKMLLKNYKLSDDIAFRFSDRNWSEFPLTAEKYAQWIHRSGEGKDVMNLFMDYETFGEHQWEDTGIFEFLKKVPDFILKHPQFNFLTPSEAANVFSVKDVLDVSQYVSWADSERDLTAWQGNPLQDEALETLFTLENRVLEEGDQQKIHLWRLLQTSDHFYYMCTKWCEDGDVHKYFNPYQSPYDAYINYRNVIRDFSNQVTKV